MFIILILIGLIVLSIISCVKANDLWSNDAWIAGAVLAPIATLILALILSINHGTANSKIAQYEVIKESIEVSRQEGSSDIERAALSQKIIQVNQEIASYKYWNGTMFHLMVPDKLAELEPLK